MRATMLLTTERGSGMRRSDCMLHNDSAGNGCHLHAVRSSIPRTPVRDRPKLQNGEGPFCVRVAKRFVGRAYGEEQPVSSRLTPNLP